MNAALDHFAFSAIVETIEQGSISPGSIEANKLRNVIAKVEKDIGFLEHRILLMSENTHSNKLVLENYRGMLQQRKAISHSLREMVHSCAPLH